MFRGLAFLVILIFTVYSYAEPVPFFTIGIAQGGAQLSNLTGNQDYKINAGSGLFASGGIVLPISPTIPHQFEGQLGIGILYQDDYSSKADRVTWVRLPIDALYFYHNLREHFRLGWGMTYHVNGEISARGNNASANTNVDHSLGWVICAEKFITADSNAGFWTVGLRYTNIKYNLAKFDKKADGNSINFTMTFFSF